MKKLGIYLGIITALFIILYGVDYFSNQQVNSKLAEAAQRLYGTTPDKLSEFTREQLNDENYQSIILPDELAEKLANKESLFVYMFSPTCAYCKQTTPELNELAEEMDITYYQFNVLEFQDGWDTYALDATPTLIYFENGEEADRLVGGIVDEQTRETYRNFFEKYGKTG